MGRRKQGPIAPLGQGVLDGVEAGTEAEPVSAPKASRKGVFVALMEDGQIDWEHMRGSTQTSVKELLRANASQTEVSGPAVQIFSPRECGYLYAALGELEAMLARKLLGVPDDVARVIFLYSQEEVGVLGEPTADVINKHAGHLAKYREEIGLGLVLVAIHQHKFARLKMELDARESRSSETKRELKVEWPETTAKNSMTGDGT